LLVVGGRHNPSPGNPTRGFLAPTRPSGKPIIIYMIYTHHRLIRFKEVTV
jgi:hypothetical protein